MDLKIKNQTFLICGASSGFGRAVAERLLHEGAYVIAVARRKERLSELESEFPGQVQSLVGDLTDENVINQVESLFESRKLQGALLNAGGPPTLAAQETSMKDWDEAYKSVMRWKIDLSLRLSKYFSKEGYGRILFLESQSVKQPIPSLVLSNSFRAGMVGFAKTLSLEVAKKGVTVNVLAPGSHETPAINRVIKKRSEETGKSLEEVKKNMESAIPVGRMGTAEEISSLAAWLLSPLSGYVTGQTLSHDGGNIKGIFG